MHHVINSVYLAVPQVTAQNPPGMDTLTKICGWILAGAGLAILASVVIAGVKIAMGGHGHGGGGGQHTVALLTALLGGLVVATAGLLVAGVGL